MPTVSNGKPKFVSSAGKEIRETTLTKFIRTIAAIQCFITLIP